MTDQELRAHDLAVIFTQALHPDLRGDSDKSTLDYIYEHFLADYRSAYEYFSRHIS